MSNGQTTHVVMIEMPVSRAHDAMFIRRYKRVVGKFSGEVSDNLGFMREGYKTSSADEILIQANFPNGEIPKELDAALDGENYTVCRIDPVNGRVCDFEGEVVCEVYKVGAVHEFTSSLQEKLF